MIQEITIENWRDFEARVNGLEENTDPLLTVSVFRGLSSTRYGLEPSLLRIFKKLEIDNEERALLLESRALREFQNMAHLYLPSSVISSTQTIPGWWTLMQHYSAPTRLLDWTASIYVAAYFTVVENIDEDGIIWAADVRQGLSLDEYSEIPSGNQDEEDFFLAKAAPKTLHFVEPFQVIERMANQQSMFSASRNILEDHQDIIYSMSEKAGDKIIAVKIIVPSKIKLDIAKRLRRMNLTASSLFPGLDGLGESIKQLIMLADS